MSAYKEIYVTRKEEIRVQTTQYTNAVPLTFRIMDWVIPSNSTVQIYVKKPSGTMVYNNASISDNDVIVTTTTQMTAEIGDSECQIRIVNGNKVLHTFVFTLEVSKTIVDDSAVESQDEFTALTAALSRLTSLVVREVVSVEALPITVSNAAITARHRVVNAVIGTPAAQTDHWTVETAAGSFTITGSINGSSTVELIFMDMI